MIACMAGFGLFLMSLSAHAFEQGACIDLKGPTLDGTFLNSPSGEWTIVEFWATWCRPCHTSLEKLQEYMKSTTNLRLVGINSESNASVVRRFKARKGWRFPTLLDPEHRWLKRANPRALPLTVVLDPDGCVVWRATGGDDQVLQDLHKFLSSVELKPHVKGDNDVKK